MRAADGDGCCEEFVAREHAGAACDRFAPDERQIEPFGFVFAEASGDAGCAKSPRARHAAARERFERDALCFDLRLKHQIGDIVEVRGETHRALANPSSPSLSSKPNTMLAT